MKEELIKILNSVLSELAEDKNADLSDKKITIQENKDKTHGDYASNLAMSLSKELKDSPKNIANLIISKIPQETWIKKIEVAGPGFINFFLDSTVRSEVLIAIDEQKAKYGNNSIGNNQRVLIEYVSSNPTGPLHVGHGRGAVFGSVLAKLLSATGYSVDEEYYVNDQGRQMNILATSTWLRYLQEQGFEIKFSSKIYQGDYVIDLAKKLSEKNQGAFSVSSGEESELKELLARQETEEDLDKLIEWSRKCLGENFIEVKNFSLISITESIKNDLQKFGVNHTSWFNESSMYKKEGDQEPIIEKAIKLLESSNHVYKKEGALWFKSTEFGDDKDRVVQRANGENTYFASDISYHLNKYERGYERIINVWGSDHHGYIPRVSAAMQALGQPKENLEVVFIQFANLLRDGKKVSMSTRGGEFITLRELINEVSAEAARFFYINRKADQHLDFDLELAKSQTKDNPLYYIQYAHARICSVFETLEKGNKKFTPSIAKKNLNLLSLDREAEIEKMLILFPEIINRAAKSSEPHLICYYLKDLASLFHSYYNNEKFLVEEVDLMNARLFLLKGVKQVLANGLSILGIEAPNSM
tara:strand:- start:3411 stop:5174 length:1764 start_codon:yes stop_codon:yes gene_type:complete